MADYLTIDVYDKPPLGSRLWSRNVKDALQQNIPGLRSVTVNHSNHMTHSLAPTTLLLRPGRVGRNWRVATLTVEELQTPRKSG